MRLFVAIDLPGEVAGQLQQLQKPDLKVRWISSERLHLTLRFIGNAKLREKTDLVKALSKIQISAFYLHIKELGYFPQGKNPKIIWAGIEENIALLNLQKKIENACRFAGFDPDQREFKPHITTGRVREASKKEIISYINNHGSLSIEDVPVKEFILYESTLHPEGAAHNPLEHFSLNSVSNSSR